MIPADEPQAATRLRSAFSETGARLKIDGALENLNLKEFFLLLSSTGLAFRRCEFAWLKGELIGVKFLRGKDIKR